MDEYSKVQRPTRHILGHFGDGGVTVASARIVACAMLQCIIYYVNWWVISPSAL